MHISYKEDAMSNNESVDNLPHHDMHMTPKISTDVR